MNCDIIAGYDMSPFIRRYAKYLSEKSGAYRGTAMDFCKVKRGLVAITVFYGPDLKYSISIVEKKVEHYGP